MVEVQGLVHTREVFSHRVTPLISTFLTVNPNKIWESKEMIDLVNPAYNAS